MLVGSLRKGSYTRMVANQLIELAPARLQLQLVEIRDLPLYDQDLEDNVPPAWAAFRQRIRRADAVLFATPEYNRSIPAPLKNAIDVGSRPYGESAWEGTPGAVISVSPGRCGAFGANHHVRQTMVFLDMPAMPQPEAYISEAAKIFDDRGELVDDKMRVFLQRFVDAFDRWIDVFAGRRERVKAA